MEVSGLKPRFGVQELRTQRAAEGAPPMSQCDVPMGCPDTPARECMSASRDTQSAKELWVRSHSSIVMGTT